MSTSSRVVLVRHGQTEWSKTGRHTGRTDIPLSDEGLRCAEFLPRALSRWKLAKIWTSPLQRAKETCRLAGLLESAEVLDDLAEWDYGKAEGRTTAELREEIPDWSVWGPTPMGGETVEQVGARADRVIARARAVDGDVALFAHGHLLRILTARWLGCPAVDGKLFALGTCSVSVLGYEHEQPVIERWNDRSHMPT